jgi:hypothetical protein
LRSPKREPPDDRLAFLPTPEQQLLLQACLFDGEAAVAAWQAWRSRVALERIDLGSSRLLPLLVHRLHELGVQDAALSAYRGVQRRSWARNQMLFRGAGEVLRRLRGAGIEAMALKGVVLASACYETMSLRPMGDLDLLVQRGDVLGALNALESLGWTLQAPGPRPRTAADFALRHACAYEDPANPEVSVDLHWRLLWEKHSPEAEAAMWERAVAFEVGGEPCLRPSPADVLLHVCAHGAKWNGIAPLRWVADATLLLRREPIDWTHLVAQAARLRVELALAQTLAYLRDVIGAPVDPDALAALVAAGARPIDRLFHDAQQRPPAARSRLTAARMHLHIARSHQPPSGDLRGYWGYLRAWRAGRGDRALWSKGRSRRDPDQ